MLKNRILYLGLLAASIYFAVLFCSYTATVLLGFVVCLPILSGSSLLFLKRKLKVEIDREYDVEELGTDGEITVCIENKSLFPVLYGTCEIRWKHELSDDEHKVKLPFSVDGRQKNIVKIPVQFAHCGKLSLCVTKVHIFDYLGVFKRTKKLNVTQNIVVIPKLDGIEEESFAGADEKNVAKTYDYCGENRQELKEIREYRPGDSLKQIHWKVTAKQKKLMTKVMENTKEVDKLLCFSMLYKNGEIPDFSWYDTKVCVLAKQSMDELLANVSHGVVWYHPTFKNFFLKIVEEKTDLMELLEDVENAGIGEEHDGFEMELEQFIKREMTQSAE